MDDESSKMFRKVSLERLSSPDRLDQLVQVTSPQAWIALFAFFGLMFVLILWSLFGSIPTKVAGTAILIKTGGVINVVSSVPGTVSDVAIISGEKVRRGQEVARIRQSEFIREISDLREKNRALKQQFEREKMAREVVRKNLQGRMQRAISRLKAREQLLKEGLVTKQAVEETRVEIENIKHELDQLTITDTRQANELAAAQRDFMSKIQRYNSYTRIDSPSDGRIVEVKVNQGSVVNPGTPIISMEQTGEDIKEIEAVIFVPALEGSKVHVGMNVNISPSVVKQEEYGTLKASVIAVSQYPTTVENMMRFLNNETLVKQILAAGPAIEIRANLLLNPKTKSGYQWTSASGPPIELQSGMLGTADITIMQQRPINLLIPTIKRVTGIY